MLTIPPPFLDVPYVAARYPGEPGVESGAEALADGANCQLYAYALLRHFGRAIGDLRSRELWLDRVWTEPVVELAALDLLLFNRTPDPYGAHVAVCLGDGVAIHLSMQVGRPAIWLLEDFARRPEYLVFIGAKRARRAAP
jgi:hypothetical protein